MDATTGLDTRTFSTLKGLGLGSGTALDGTLFDGVEYGNIEEMVILLGDGGDTFTITESGDISLTLSTAGGNDTVNVKNIGGPVRVMGGAGADTFNVNNDLLEVDGIGDLLTIEGNAYLSESVNRVFYDQTIEIPGQPGTSLHDAVLNSSIRVFINSDPLNNAGGYPIFTFIDAAGTTTKYTRQQLAQIVFRAGSDGVPSATVRNCGFVPPSRTLTVFLVEDLVQEVNSSGVPVWRDTNGNRVAWTPGDFNNFPFGLLDFSNANLLQHRAIIEILDIIFGFIDLSSILVTVETDILQSIAPSLIPVNRVNAAGKPLTLSAINENVSGAAATDTLNVVDTGDSAENTGNLTATRITGLGMGADDPAKGIEYSGIETLNIGLGSDRDTFTIEGTHNGVTNLDGNGGADIINIRTISGPTSVDAGTGSDTVNVGSNTQGTTALPDSINGGTVNAIAASLTINGNDPSGSGSDVLNVDDTGEGATNTGTLTTTQITGLDMTVGITYVAFETLNIGLGTKQDTFTIQSTHGGVTKLDGNNGDDIINVQTIDGVTTVNGGNGSDTFNVGTHALGVGSNANNNIDGVLNSISAALILNGNDPSSGSDVLNVDDTDDSGTNTGNLTKTQITGLGMGGITYGTIETLNINLGSGVDTFTIESTHAGVTNLNGNGGADIINIRTISGPTTVNTHAGADNINVGSNALGDTTDRDNNSDGTLNGIGALLTINGGGTGSERDLITVDDTADTASNTGVLTANRITGLGMGNADQSVVESTLGISYSAFEDLVISLGSGADTFTINSTHNGSTGGTTETTTLNTGAGIDLVHINDVSDTLEVSGQADVDTMNVNGTGTGSVSTLNGADGADIFNVHDMDGRVNVRGGADNDTVNVTDEAPDLPTGARTTPIGSIDEIDALLDVDGGTGLGDVMNVDDSLDVGTADGTLTATTLRGLELNVGINYLGLEELNIWLGIGDNTFDIDGTHAGETTLNTAEGADTINVNDASGLVTVNAEQGDDVINVRATGLGSELRINGHEGLDTINLSDLSPTLPAPYPAVLPPPAAASIGNIDGIDGLVVIDGGTEFDVINIDDSGNGTAKAGTLTLNTLRGWRCRPASTTLGLKTSISGWEPVPTYCSSPAHMPGPLRCSAETATGRQTSATTPSPSMR